jgi:hypothetical protein
MACHRLNEEMAHPSRSCKATLTNKGKKTTTKNPKPSVPDLVAVRLLFNRLPFEMPDMHASQRCCIQVNEKTWSGRCGRQKGKICSLKTNRQDNVRAGIKEENVRRRRGEMTLAKKESMIKRRPMPVG